ncbi:MAG: tRNA lysidine(34) synthetase TilS [Sphingobacteriaceae bacterium]|nr:tRNA lysidine(34) synthetase TilS [Sphingobacteriaceae bacterium]
MFARKEDILAYAKKNKLKYRDDSSNDEVKYKRNYLRHEIIPGLKKLNPALESTFDNNIRLFRQTAAVVKQFVSEKRKEIIVEGNDSFKINIKKLVAEESAELLLFEWLSPKGFNNSQVEQIFNSLNSKSSGKLFFSETHQALIDRDFIFVEFIEIKTPQKEFLIKEIADFKKLPFKLNADLSASKKIMSGKNIAQIDFTKPVFPLKIRKWKAGDKFMPLGMTGYKKISDFLINQKLNRFEKENIWLLLNKNEVVWVIGQRLDERYKIKPNTKKILKLEVQ